MKVLSPLDQPIPEQSNSKEKRPKKAQQKIWEIRYKEHESIVQREMRRQHRSYVHNMLTESEVTSTATNKKFWT